MMINHTQCSIYTQMIDFQGIRFYNYYDIDIDKILLFKKSDNEYIIRYNDVNKMIIAPLQLKIKNSYNELNTFANNNRVMLIMMIKNF